jgi:hypothetical protein
MVQGRKQPAKFVLEEERLRRQRLQKGDEKGKDQKMKKFEERWRARTEEQKSSGVENRCGEEEQQREEQQREEQQQEEQQRDETRRWCGTVGIERSSEAKTSNHGEEE